MTPHPMLRLEFFRNPTFAGGAAAIGVTFFGLFGAMFLSTQYVQSVQGYSGLLRVAQPISRITDDGASERVVGHL